MGLLIYIHFGISNIVLACSVVNENYLLPWAKVINFNEADKSCLTNRIVLDSWYGKLTLL